MVTVWAVPGAVQAPVLGSMVPPVADQTTSLVAPPVTVAVKVVAVPVVRLTLLGLSAVTATVWGSRTRVLLAVVPARLVTVRMKVLVAVMEPLPKWLPLLMTPTPLFTLPMPSVKVGVMRVPPP